MLLCFKLILHCYHREKAVDRAYSYSGYKFYVHLIMSYILSLITKTSIRTCMDFHVWRNNYSILATNSKLVTAHCVAPVVAPLLHAGDICRPANQPM